MHPRVLMMTVLCATSALGCHEIRDVLTSNPGLEAGTPSDTGAGERGFSVAAGYGHACAVVGGVLQCWGGNGRGQLGTGDVESQPAAVRVATASDWVEIVAATESSCARRGGGSVWCWGGNESGQLGVADFVDRTEPTFVSLPASATQIAAKHATGCAILSTGALYCWGENEEGQLGQGDSFPGTDAPEPVQVTLDTNWRRVDTGHGHTCAIRNDATLWCWGRNTTGECGLGAGAPPQLRVPTQVPGANWVSVSTGQNHTCALKADGSAHCTGNGEFGQLGLGNRDSYLDFQRLGLESDWSALSTNTFASCGIRSQGSLFCWGRNIEGQLGTGDWDDRITPQFVSGEAWSLVSAGRFFNCAARRELSVACSGENIAGQLGVGDLERRNQFTNVLLVP
jgi:alpha-tubulin suppressor-like RCC1 family protein